MRTLDEIAEEIAEIYVCKDNINYPAGVSDRLRKIARELIEHANNIDMPESVKIFEKKS